MKIDEEKIIKSIKDYNSFKIIELAVDDIKEKCNLSTGEILSYIDHKQVSKEILVPVSIFKHENLSALEAICKYMKEELDLNFSKIALLLKRDARTIWTTYRNATIKRKRKLHAESTALLIPLSVIADRRLSVLGSIVRYLKDKFNLRYSEIAVLLSRNERNIWAIYNKSKKK